MAKTIAKGYTDTAIAGNPAMTVTVGKLNFAADHKIRSEEPGEVIMVNVTSPYDQPETFRISQKEVKDIYANTDVDVSARLPVKNGKATLFELKELWVETDSEDPTYRKLIPFKAGIQVTVPSYGNVTADDVLGLLLRTFGLIYETGTVTSAGINNVLHGVLKKADQ